MSTKPKVRPAGVPATAVWSPSDGEWVQATLDAKGRKHGTVRYYRPEGSLCCETEFEVDLPHGSFTRYHENGQVSRRGSFARGAQVGLDTTYPSKGPTTERGFPPHASERIDRYEQEWRDGVLVRRTFLAKDGTPLFPDGKPYPKRPPNVPADALPERAGWELGAVDRQGAKVGTWIVFDQNGGLLHEDEHEHGRVHRRTRPLKTEDARVAFERGEWGGTGWLGDVSLLDAERNVLRNFDPTGAADVSDPKLVTWVKRVRATDWAELESAYGPATLVGALLLTMGCGTDAAVRRAALDDLTNRICHQGSVYAASVIVVDRLLELVALRTDQVRSASLSLVFAIASLPAQMFTQVKKQKKSAAYACVQALVAGSKHVLASFPSLTESERCTAVACLAGCFEDDAAAKHLSKLARASDTSRRVRAAAITALGNLSIATKALDADVKTALADEDVAMRVAAVIGRALGHHRPGKGEVAIMLDALANGDDVRETVATLPFVDDSLEVELAQLLAVACRVSAKARAQVIDSLLSTLGNHRSLGALSIALAGLDVVFANDDDDYDDDARATPDAKRFVRALVDKEDLWTTDGKHKKLLDLAAALEQHELPVERDALRRWSE